MRQYFPLLILVVVLLASCTQSTTQPQPSITPQQASTSTSSPSPLAPTATATIESSAQAAPTLTSTPTSKFTIQVGESCPADKPLIAYQGGDSQNKMLFLADLAENVSYQFNFPEDALFATPFLAGLSPDGRYFVYFTGGWLETVFDIEYLRASTPDLMLHVLDLRRGEVIFSTRLLSPQFPNDLAKIADTIQDDWAFTSSDYTFEEVMAATRDFMLERIRNVAWSPDGSLLAFIAQLPGPSSDLYFFSPATSTTWPVFAEPDHILKTVWSPDSSALIMVTSLYDRHAREDTTYLLTREASLLTSFTSQIWFFSHWHDAAHAILYSGTDAGDYAELKTVSAVDGTIDLLWDGTYAEIALSPDLSTFLSSSSIPTAPYPPHKGLFLGRFDDGSLHTLSEDWGWGVTYWGSERFAFAASSTGAGTIGVALDGTFTQIDQGKWRLVASPDGSYLAGYYNDHPSYSSEITPGLRIFAADGLLLESRDNLSVSCVSWNTASSTLAYQVENSLYFWDSASGVTHLISDQLNREECGFRWVSEVP